MNLWLVPCSDFASSVNIQRTLANPVAADLQVQAGIPVTADTRAWGTRSGTKSQGAWERMQPGDICLFYSQVPGQTVKRYAYMGTIAHTLQKVEVSTAFWNSKEFDLVFFLEEVVPIALSPQQLSQALSPYRTNYRNAPPLGLTRVDTDVAKHIEGDHGTLRTWILKISQTPPPTQESVPLPTISASEDEPEAENEQLPESVDEFTIDDAMAKLFLPQADFEKMLVALRRKKNIIIQGAPGVGKTFLARRLGFAFLGKEDLDRVSTVQFHQSYGYEDFIQGFRPSANGGFNRCNGVFYDFCKKAEERIDQHFVFIIDEINRGNVSRIFGELLTLIEHDHRGKDFAVPLTYSTRNDKPFFVPANLHLVGLMNTADRSLAMVDYALRRRFAFFSIEPEFARDSFRNYLAPYVQSVTLKKLIERMNMLNAAIREDRNLGSGFQIGHSYFCPTNEEVDLGDDWYRNVIDLEIGPLLQEYWFDEPEKANEWQLTLKQ